MDVNLEFPTYEVPLRYATQPLEGTYKLQLLPEEKYYNLHDLTKKNYHFWEGVWNCMYT